MSGDHELVEAFRRAGVALNTTLEAMLNEHPDHRTERRGCGFTQATRHLAARTNEPRGHRDTADMALFAHWAEREHSRIERWLADGALATWRHWDRDPPFAELAPDNEALDRGAVANEAARQAWLRELPGSVQREESALLAAIIRDIMLPDDRSALAAVQLPAWPDKLPVGSCPTAEKCFLELAHGFMPRKGRCNHLVDDAGRTVLIEKINMGDDHSCVTLVPVVLNGVTLPPGALMAVHYDDEQVSRDPAPGPFRGSRIPLAECEGFRMLRLTTLAVSPANRARAFSVHFEAQRQAGLFEPGTTRLEQLRRIAVAETA